MPELPDVEGFRKVLVSCAKGRRIKGVEVRDKGVLLARTDGPTLMLHFGMTGRLVCARPDDAAEPHDRVLFTLTGGRQLRFRDQRKLQGLWLAEEEQAVERMLSHQGPDAMTVNRKDFETALSARRGKIKSVLTDQSVLAGLGNLLADEILWRARIAPTHPATDLTEADLRNLHTCMRRTLRSAVDAECVPPRNSWLTGHRDSPEDVCPRCGTALRRTRVAGRGTVWCPRCQPE
jgi:formamidopyrimidine-DNA glycosylase